MSTFSVMNTPGRLLQNVQATSPPLLMCKDESDRKCYWTDHFGELWTFQWEWSRRSEWDELKWPALQQRPVLPSPPLASTSNKACFLPTSVGHKRTVIRGRELGKVERQEQRGGENTSMHDNEESIQLAAVHGLWWWLPKTGGRSRSLTDSSRRRTERTEREVLQSSLRSEQVQSVREYKCVEW